MFLRFFSSYWLTVVLLLLMGLAAAIATFIENDFGTNTARIFFYESWWFGLVLFFTCLNIALIIYKTKMWKSFPKFTFHLSFLLIFFGALSTHFFGIEGTFSLRKGEIKDIFLSSEPYIQIEFIKNNKSEKANIAFRANAWKNRLDKTLILNGEKINLKLIEARVLKEGLATKSELEIELAFKGEKKKIILNEEFQKEPKKSIVSFNQGEIKIGYGPTPLKLPFSILLKEFKTNYYPGGYAPAGYSSDIKIKDKIYNISMNKPLRVEKYAIYQSSFSEDEAVFWINKDPGKIPTYIGYALLFLGLILNILDPKSRLQTLIKKTKKLTALTVLLLTLPYSALYGSTYEEVYLKDLKDNSVELSKKFSKLTVQSRSGRMKPMDTLCKEIMYKISGKDSLYGLNANQLVLGMFTHQRLWKHIPIIKIKTKELKEIVGLEKSEKLAKFDDFFEGQTYKLELLVNEALKTSPSKRGEFEKDLIAVDERLNITLMTFYGLFFKLFPDSLDWNAPWKSVDEIFKNPTNESEEFLSKEVMKFMDFVFERDFKQAIKPLESIDAHAKKFGNENYIDATKLKIELLLNDLKVFSSLIKWYILFGFLTLLLGFTQILKKKLIPKWTNSAIYFIFILLFTVHTAGILGRWYISGFIPMSNTYESIIYISWSCALAGLILFKRSFLGLGAALFMAGIFAFVAHLGGIDPEITPLVPVLDSFWLSIHVSIITASYGFLALSAIVGALILTLYAISRKIKINYNQIKYLAYIVEISLIIGLSLLVIGNFIGGIWANESWGRYWGWDPKETWTFVSIALYTAITHYRLIKQYYCILNFALFSLLGFGSILMTYFGVNFYLAGLHSYAKGDPVPIPLWIYVVVCAIFVLYIFALRNKNQIKKEF